MLPWRKKTDPGPSPQEPEIDPTPEAPKDPRRADPRLKMPLDVTIDGKPATAYDWSFGGVGIEGGDAEWELGKEVRAVLHFKSEKLAFELDTKAVLVWVSPETSRAGFRFLELQESEREMLRYLARAHLEAKTAGRPEREATYRTWGENVRLALSITVVGVLLAIGARRLHDSMYLIHSKYAMVTRPLVKLESAMGGRLESIHAKPGTKLRKGDVVFVLDSLSLGERRELIRAELARETGRLDELRDLASEGPTRRSIELQKNKLKELQARLSKLEKESEALVIRSPCDCSVAEIAATPGQVVEPGSRLATLFTSGPAKVSVTSLVSAGEADRLEAGGSARVWLTGEDEPFAAEIVTISKISSAQLPDYFGLRPPPSLSEALGVVTVRPLAAPARLKFGTTAKVTFNLSPLPTGPSD